MIHDVRKSGLSTHAVTTRCPRQRAGLIHARFLVVTSTVSRDAATPRFWGYLFSMSYKTERGNVAKKSLRFHAPVEIVSEYQSVTKCPVAASRRSSLARPGRGETSGGSLRSSRQAVA